MKIGPDGRLHAINPEAGFFGVAPGTSYKSNPMAMDTIKSNSIFTNCVLTDDGDIWWEGMDGRLPAHGIDWKGHDWTPESDGAAARIPTPASPPRRAQCPVICPDWENPDGVPIDIFVFGGRRASVVPLVTEAFDWDHGVFMGATAASETTAANIGAVGNLRRDPFAMQPFCGYNMGDYFQHWFDMGDRLGAKAPRIFYVNWFRKTADGKWLWPGFGENSRVLKWMCERVDRHGGASRRRSAMCRPRDLDLAGLDIAAGESQRAAARGRGRLEGRVPDIEKHFAQFGDRLPARLAAQVGALRGEVGVGTRGLGSGTRD